jgi:hypothetical protein
MTRVKEMNPRLDAFKKWLVARGAELLVTMGEWELLRFKSGDNLCIIYYKKNGEVTFHGKSEEVWKAYLSGSSWRAMPATARRQRSSTEITTLRKRDGDHCFFCMQLVSQEDESVEHLVSLTHNGPQHISNKFLAHKKCNAQANHLSAPEKIAIHTRTAIAVAIINYKRRQRSANEQQTASVIG